MVAIFYQQNNLNNLIFSKNTHQALTLGLILFLSMLCMLVDYHSTWLNFVRHGVAFFTVPIQYVVDYPVRILDWTRSLVGSKKKLVDENIALHYQQMILESKLQQLMSLTEENLQLKQLLLTADKVQMQAMAAQILAVDTNSARQVLILNKGKHDGAYVGQPVLDAKGVMGQIIDVGYLTSTVLLISDAKSAVPVRNNRTGERAILVGTNDASKLALIHLHHTAAMAKGDLLVTSGLGRLYPEGYPVGYIKSVTVLPGEAFVTVIVTPIALLNHNRLVLLIWPDKDQAHLTKQINERMDVLGKMMA